MDWREREKNKEGNRESPSLSPLPHPLVVSFFCSHLYELSPRSEHLEQARHQAAPNHSSLRKWVIAWDQTKRSRVYGIVWGDTKPRAATWNNAETCCSPLCPNNFKNSHSLAFYRIPKARRIRREYVRLLGSDDLNLNSDSTRICSAHWDGVEKRNGTHLPSIFPWSKNWKMWILYSSEATSNSCTERDFEADSENEVSVEQIDVDTRSNSVSPTLSFCDAETQTEIIGEFLDGLEFEFKSTVEEKDELTTDSACIKKSEVWHFKI